MRNLFWNDIRIAALKLMVEKGYRPEVIAQTLGCTRRAVIQQAYLHGIRFKDHLAARTNNSVELMMQLASRIPMREVA